jgi:hypothetical protein
MRISKGRSMAGAIDIEAAAACIVRQQRSTGEIPWSRGLKTDPWDHIEAVMGLDIAGHHGHARKALNWLVERQNHDGSWFAAYRNGNPIDRTRDANMSAYVAVGVFHHYLITRDIDLVRRLWPGVTAAIDFALGLQAPSGEIYWAISPAGRIDQMALLTGSSSIFLSLRCALALADLVGAPQPGWRRALNRLGSTIRNKPYRFNMTKSRFSMDWFYPVLCGALTGDAAQQRIDRYWKKFVVEGQGVRCVLDEPWVTLAETAELVLALHAMGNRNLAEIVFSWICDKRFADGSYWCGHTVPEMVVWPEDKMTWTNAVVSMAADALFDLTPAGQLFTHRFWSSGCGP